MVHGVCTPCPRHGLVYCLNLKRPFIPATSRLTQVAPVLAGCEGPCCTAASSFAAATWKLRTSKGPGRSSTCVRFAARGAQQHNAGDWRGILMPRSQPREIFCLNASNSCYAPLPSPNPHWPTPAKHQVIASQCPLQHQAAATRLELHIPSVVLRLNHAQAGAEAWAVQTRRAHPRQQAEARDCILPQACRTALAVQAATSARTRVLSRLPGVQDIWPGSVCFRQCCTCLDAVSIAAVGGDQ